MQNTKFEDNIQVIDIEIAKRRNLWNLSSIQWMDYDDVSQIIRLHIYEKWGQYNQEKPLSPWLNKIISNQIRNIIRNIYGNYAKPCVKCSAAEGERCKIYQSQCSQCPLYASWEKGRKRAHDIKMTLPIENYMNEQEIGYHDTQDIDSIAKTIHEKMEDLLKPNEWAVYKLLFIENLPEEEVATRMGYKNEKRKHPRCKQIKNIRASIIMKVKKAISNNEIDIL